MNIAFDSSAIHYSHYRGMGKYFKSHIESIIEIDKDNNYFIFDLFNDLELDEFFCEKNINVVHFDLGKEAEFAFEEYQEITSKLVTDFVKLYNIDIFYITQLFCINYLSLYTRFLENKNCKVVMFLFDVIPHLFKDRYLADKNLKKNYYSTIEHYKYADKILTDSQSAKDDLLKIVNIDEDIIDVVHSGPSYKIDNFVFDNNDYFEIKKKLNISDKYILTILGDDYRKNIDGLIKGYYNLPVSIIEGYQLVIVTDIGENTKDYYYSLIDDDKFIKEDRIVFTGYLSDRDLITLNKHANLFVFVSKYEGFGLPVLDSWQLGLPVVTSNNSSLQEIAKDAAILVDPNSTESISKGIMEALVEEKNEELRKLGLLKKENFSWEKNAKLTIDAFNELRQNNHHIISKVNENQKEKIAFFTPLPPFQSGISDYSEDIINEISKYFDIDVFVDDGFPLEHNIFDVDNVNVYNYKSFNSKNYFKTIYQMGNSTFHSYMFDIIRNNRENNIVVIHDINLLDALYVSFGVDVFNKEFLDYFNEDFPDYQLNGEKVQELFLNKSDFFIENPINSFISNYASQIIVHSEYCKEKLLKTNIDRNVFVVNSYARINSNVNKSESRKKLGINNEDIIIAAFGHIHKSKRIIPVVNAFKEIAKTNNNIKLYLVGKPADDLVDFFDDFITDNNLEGRLIITGFISLDEFNDYIDATDICVNLRYPYNGETSGSLMRILSKGKVAIVNDIGSFSEIPDDCCYKIPDKRNLSDDNEIKVIKNAINELIENSDLRNSIGNNAKQLAIKELDIEKIGIDYRDIILKTNNDPLLTDEVLERINLTLKNKGYNYYDALSIAKTLAFVKGEKIIKKEKGIIVSNLLETICGENKWKK